MIGAVSRGTGCANFNQPGIFSRVARHLDWIRRETADGNCEGGGGGSGPRSRDEDDKPKEEAEVEKS